MKEELKVFDFYEYDNYKDIEIELMKEGAIVKVSNDENYGGMKTKYIFYEGKLMRYENEYTSLNKYENMWNTLKKRNIDNNDLILEMSKIEILF